jgi:hypothetical protein
VPFCISIINHHRQCLYMAEGNEGETAITHRSLAWRLPPGGLRMRLPPPLPSTVTYMHHCGKRPYRLRRCAASYV